jgi:hypothetical protein
MKAFETPRKYAAITMDTIGYLQTRRQRMVREQELEVESRHNTPLKVTFRSGTKADDASSVHH